VSLVAKVRSMDRTDAELLAKIAAGDLSSLGLLFDRYAIDVRRFVARLGIGASDVDDLTQTTFLLVIDAASSFRGAGSGRAWLFGLAANLVRRHRRSFARVATRLAAWALEPRVDARPSPENASDVGERATLAARALSRLPAKKREVFVMVVMEDMTAEEVAAALGIPIGTVWTRLHHARRALRAHLQEEEGAT
jgi:RNA polymerase sigma factor (sigma-70 family)